MLLLCEKAALKRYFRLTLLHFSPFTEFTPLTERFELFAEHLSFLPSFFVLFCWHFRTFCRAFRISYRAFCTFYRAFCTFYWAFTPFAELSCSLLNLRPCRIFLVCTALHVYPCIHHCVLCFLCALFVPLFCVICILRHTICTFNHTICTFNHAICAVFSTISGFYSAFCLSVLLFHLFAHKHIDKTGGAAPTF